MKIPNFIDSKIVGSDGKLTPEWKQIFMQLFTQLHLNVSDEGFIVAAQTAANIALLDTIKYNGSIIYNSDTNKLMVNENGSYKTVTTT